MRPPQGADLSSTGRARAELILHAGTPAEKRFAFEDRIEIGRQDRDRPTPNGMILVDDLAVSARHCVVTRDAEGRCFVQDMSRNGTRLDGRRIPPGVEVEFRSGQRLSVGLGVELSLRNTPQASDAPRRRRGTMVAAALEETTVLVGDIRGYSQLVETVPPALLQRSVCRVFENLASLVERCGGTVKEFQGDAVCAFWEPGVGTDHAIRACRGALCLGEEVKRLASDPSLWEPAPGLGIDWALATGTVAFGSVGGEHPSGLAMVGEPMIIAYRLEKLAGAETGTVLACSRTHELARDRFRFRSVGWRALPGLPGPIRVYALLGERID